LVRIDLRAERADLIGRMQGFSEIPFSRRIGLDVINFLDVIDPMRKVAIHLIARLTFET